MEKHYLTLSDEFVQFCKINGFTDVKTKANEVFTIGFNLLKYGNQPPINKRVEKEKKDNQHGQKSEKNVQINEKNNELLYDE